MQHQNVINTIMRFVQGFDHVALRSTDDIEKLKIMGNEEVKRSRSRTSKRLSDYRIRQDNLYKLQHTWLNNVKPEEKCHLSNEKKVVIVHEI